jgi:hypothetical protein
LQYYEILFSFYIIKSVFLCSICSSN